MGGLYDATTLCVLLSIDNVKDITELAPGRRRHRTANCPTNVVLSDSGRGQAAEDRRRFTNMCDEAVGLQGHSFCEEQGGCKMYSFTMSRCVCMCQISGSFECWCGIVAQDRVRRSNDMQPIQENLGVWRSERRHTFQFQVLNLQKTKHRSIKKNRVTRMDTFLLQTICDFTVCQQRSAENNKRLRRLVLSLSLQRNLFMPLMLLTYRCKRVRWCDQA